MKAIKILALAMALSMTAVSFAACNNPNNQGGDDVVVVSSAADNNGNNGNGGQTEATQASEQQGEFDGWSFVYNGVNVNVGTDLNEVESKLGELNKDYTELKATSCAGLGLSRTLTFHSGSFVINTNPEGTKDIISNISLFDDTVTTAEGLYIGSTLDDVKAKYGEPDPETSTATTLTYRKGHSILVIIVSEDKVANIVYNYAV
ncbi:MAG: hypothetical protein J6X33_03260 [Clostridiales bacterium]|nr:hypothetical protein [Clostridiales bacterium]